MAAACPTSVCQTPRYREQARSHRDLWLGTDIGCAPENVGASLLAMAAACPTFVCQTPRYREQARSHRDLWLGADIGCAPEKCGSEPARDGGGLFNICVTDIPLSRAGSLPQR